jgi:hypothetical protein
MGKPTFSNEGNSVAYFHKRIFWLNGRLMVPKLTTDSLRVKDNLVVNKTTTLVGHTTLTGGFKGGNEKVTAAKTLTAADSGKTFLLDSTAGFAITLPTATTEATGEALVGTHFRFILDVDGNNDITIIRGDTGNDAIVGHVIDAGNSFATGAAAITVASNVITFDDSASLAIGDYVDVVCTLGNATTVKYMVTGIASA